MALRSKKQIDILVRTDGKIELEGQNFKGNECEKATSFLEKLLGKVKRRKRKPERWINRRQGFVSNQTG